MYIVASYRHSLHAELVISEMETYGIPKENIVAIPLDRRNEHLLLLDTMHHSDGHSMIDLASVFGTIFMLLGAIYGFVLPGGPILWAFAGLIAGGVAGYAIKWKILKNKGHELGGTGGEAELFIMVNCTDSQGNEVEKIFWNHLALGVGRLS